MKRYFLVDKHYQSHNLPHYYEVPIREVIKVLMELNPQIERVGEVRY